LQIVSKTHTPGSLPEGGHVASAAANLARHSGMHTGSKEMLAAQQ